MKAIVGLLVVLVLAMGFLITYLLVHDRHHQQVDVTVTQPQMKYHPCLVDNELKQYPVGQSCPPSFVAP